MPFINKSPLNYEINTPNSIRIFEDERAPTSADFKNFIVGDEWWDTAGIDFWKLVFKTGTSGTWRKMAGTGAASELFTPDVGGQVGPDGLNNINLLGGAGITTTGTPGTNTLTIALTGGGTAIDSITGDSGGAVPPDAAGNFNMLGNTAGFLNGIQFTGTPGSNTMSAMDLRNITVYVVDSTAGETEYTTVQAAITAANAAGGGTVYVRPGTYTEDLTLFDAVDIVGAVATPAGFQTTIIGSHAPPATGAISFRSLALSDTTNILNSAAAGTTTIVIQDCITDIGNGYTFQLANWTGLIAFINSHSTGTQDGFADIGAGGANFLGLDSTLGIGTTNLMALGGVNRINNCNVNCQMDWVGTASGIIRASQLTETWLVSDNAACVMTDTLFINDSSATFLNHTSNGNVTLSNVTISTDQDPDVITGTGTVIFGDVVFALNSDINVGITKQSVGNVETGPTHIGSGFTDPTNHIDIVEEVIGDDVTVLLNNTDNTDPASNAIVNSIVGGSNGGDPFIHFDVTGAAEKSIGFDNSDSDNFKITTGSTPSAATTHWQLTIAGERTMPLQPAFLAYNSADDVNQTGNAAVAIVEFNTELYDQNDDFAANTFTAPVTGVYSFEASVGMSALNGANGSSLVLVTTLGGFILGTANPTAGVGPIGDFILGGSVKVPMTAGNTAHIALTNVGAGADNNTINGTASPYVTWFSGSLYV